MALALYIKNMVCPRCIASVKQIFDELNIEYRVVNLGEVILKDNISISQKKIVAQALENNGFELLENQKSQLIAQIKALIIHQIHYEKELLPINFSKLLSENLNHEYTYLSKLFSSVEGITIERFILTQKIEKVKELLFYNEMTLSEIAYHLNYSSVAHLSGQFKKETGMTPTQFKNLKKPGHLSLDTL